MFAAQRYTGKKTFGERYDNYGFGLWGLILHLMLVWGILDVNFHSPIIQGLPPVLAVANAPAKRLVLFVADGLRYRTFMESPPQYLRNVMKRDGAWGVSHTRMPTESRPGNIAIVAGLYEDPSAIFKGWKENPVDFDSVLNQSLFTWAWGSPDIIPMFTKGNKRNVYGETYPPEWQDFDSTSGKALRLDSWVFDKYREWLNLEADKIKNVSGIVMYLHLLGCDTTGHSRKPNSREYTENIYYVDQRIEEVVQLTENIFGKGSTAYLFTADHGMTDWGSHGSGSTDETETPLVLWGAGVRANKSRQDVDQADLTPLMSSLIGIPIPVNNEGVLPITFLDNETYGAHALLNNIKQLAYQIEGNRIANCENSDISMDAHKVSLSKRISDVGILLEQGNVLQGTRKGIENIALAKKYLAFFRQRPRDTFLIGLSLMWFGWIMALFLKIFGVKRPDPSTRILQFVNITFFGTLILLLIRHKASGCDNWRFPCYALCALSSLWLAFRRLIKFAPRLAVRDTKKSLVEIACIVLLIGTMFMGLIYRLALSIGMLLVALMQVTVYKKRLPLLIWSGLTLALFPTLPVVEPHPRIYIVLSSMCVLGLYIILQLQSKRHKLIEISRLLVTASVYSGFIDGRSWMSWLILMTTPICIFSYPIALKERIQGIVFGLFCPFALLSASYEPFFFLVIATHLLCWPQPIADVTEERHKSLLSTEDLVKAAFFMLYTLLCFFGTGNMASISSFDPSWTRHFVTVFSPFTMSSLIVLKLSIPLILVGCTSYALGSPKAFLAVLLLGDCLSLPLMYWVNPQGSWLDIGSAISRFIIAITLPCLLLLLYCISRPLMRLSFKPLQHILVPEKMHVV